MCGLGNSLAESDPGILVDKVNMSQQSVIAVTKVIRSWVASAGALLADIEM